MQPRFNRSVRSSAAALLGIGALSVAPLAASADTFAFTYTGSFGSADALNLTGLPTGFFSGATPFTATALFDDASPNIAAPVGVPGFVAYSPVWATLNVAGQTYNVATYDQNPAQGVTVAVFDDKTPFMAGHYATGFLQNPLADGAGFIGDWLSATPTFSGAHLTSTVFTDYQGVGYGSGPAPGGNPTLVPIPLTDSLGHSYLLTLGNYDEEFSSGTALNTASLQAVPEPGGAAWLLAGGAITGLFALRRRRK